MSIRFFDMFAGIGGFRSGLESVGGFECVGHCEIDKYANQAYNAIYEPKKGEKYFEDARTIQPKDLPDFDLICAGFPCQAFSVAGQRLGFNDMRGTLVFEVARLVAERRPAFLLLENVPGLLSHDQGRTLNTIFSVFVEMGYHLEWCVHNSKYFGVPQQRRRLYIVGHLDGRGAGEIFPLGHGAAQALKQLTNPQSYWYVLKNRLKKEGSELLTFCKGLKMIAPDGKSRMTDALDTKGVLRLVQSIPSPNAEPFKMWLAQVGSERLDEIADPEKAIRRGAEFYRAKGYTEGWINQRLQTIEMRKELTDEWRARGIEKDKDYAILTNEMTKAWSGLTVQEYKEVKGLKKENLRDNMTNIELVLNMLAEVTTTALSKQEKPVTFKESKKIAKEGGTVAKNARTDIEGRLGRSVISPLNAKDKPALEIKTPEDIDDN